MSETQRLTRLDMQTAIAASDMPAAMKAMAFLWVNTANDEDVARIGGLALECFELVKQGDVDALRAKLLLAGVPAEFIEMIVTYGLRATNHDRE